ncbi:MAG: hypothetical protein V4543_09020 [Bacteroidota bacterium]
MGNKHLNSSFIPQQAANLPLDQSYINKQADFLEGWLREGNDALAIVSIKLLQDDFQCFSDWSKSEMKAFWDFNRKVHQYSWKQIYSSASKQLGQKTGFAYTVIDRSSYPDSQFKKALTPETTFFELRVNGDMRVHGFRYKALFYLCWLDREHQICP